MIVVLKRRKIISIEGKYGGAWCHWTMDKVRTTHHWGFWKRTSMMGWICDLFVHVVGDGYRIRFWYDTWCGDHTERVVSLVVLHHS